MISTNHQGRLTQPIRQLLELTRQQWDHDGERLAVRDNFCRVLACRTPALGGEVYASEDEEKILYHTCKSRCCPSCGARGTQLWQRDQWAALPDIPFVGVVLTMPNHFWPIFAAHRHLQHDLPAIGAAVLTQYAWNRWRLRLSIIVVQHTFGGGLNHNPHLHLMVSADGFDEAQSRWIKSLHFDKTAIMSLWRWAITSYLGHALRKNLLRRDTLLANFDRFLLLQARRRWNSHITPCMKKQHFLNYAGRYIRRLPISQHNILSVTDTEVIYRYKDTRNHRMVETHSTPTVLVTLLAQHVPDRYCHSMRYFGLLAPRAKRATLAAMFQTLGQHPQSRPQRLSWRWSLRRTFGIDPLRNSRGQEMRWNRKIRPVTA